ncbi:MAG TPA: hypothetical protein VMF70_04905 [Gemmatimonadales bacterium]|nr:hypothetical protein [Gemmatimonadales bacterium]
MRAFEVEVLEVRGSEGGGKPGVRLGKEPVRELEATFTRAQVATALGGLGEQGERVERAVGVCQIAAEIGEFRQERGDEILMSMCRRALLPRRARRSRGTGDPTSSS